MINKYYYLIPFFIYFFSYLLLFSRQKNLYRAFIVLIYFGFVIQSFILLLLINRYNIYHGISIASIIFFNSWILMLVIIVFSLLYKAKYVLIYVSPLAYLTLFISYFASGADLKTVLMVNSSLLITHIILILIGDSLFALAFMISLLYIFQERRVKLKKNLKIFDKNREGYKKGYKKYGWDEVFYLGKGYNLELLDNMNYQCLKIGFPTLTAGLAIGIYLSSSLFGSMMTVKPIEVISLITWLIYAILLHERIAKGLRGKKAAIFSIAGFLMIVSTLTLSLYLFPQIHGFLH